MKSAQNYVINPLTPVHAVPGLWVTYHWPAELGKTMSHQIDPLAHTWYMPGWLAQKLRDGSTLYPPV
jgi:hypothetical protein